MPAIPGTAAKCPARRSSSGLSKAFCSTDFSGGPTVASRSRSRRGRRRPQTRVAVESVAGFAARASSRSKLGRTGTVSRVQTSFLGASSGLTMGPPRFQPLWMFRLISSPSRSRLAQGVFVEFAPFRGEERRPVRDARRCRPARRRPASQMSAPPKPLAFICSRSRVMAWRGDVAVEPPPIGAKAGVARWILPIGVE